MIPFIEFEMCKHVGDILIESKKIYTGNLTKLLGEWLRSDTFFRIIDGDIIMCSQAETYVSKEFLKELETPPGDEEKGVIWSDDELFWFGFLVAYWCYLDGITGTEIADHYDFERIIDSYNPFHTVAIEHAIDIVKDVCKL